MFGEQAEKLREHTDILKDTLALGSGSLIEANCFCLERSTQGFETNNNFFLRDVKFIVVSTP